MGVLSFIKSAGSRVRQAIFGQTPKPPEFRPGEAESEAIGRQAKQRSRERKQAEELKAVREDARLKETRRTWEEAFKKKEPVKFESDPRDWMWETGRKPGIYERHIRGKAEAIIRERNDNARAYEGAIARNTLKSKPADWMFEDGPKPPSWYVDYSKGKRPPEAPVPLPMPDKFTLPRTRPTVTEEPVADNRSFGRKVADKLGGLLWWKKPKAPSEVVISRKWTSKAVQKASGTGKQASPEPGYDAVGGFSDAYKPGLWHAQRVYDEVTADPALSALASLYSSYGIPNERALEDYHSLFGKIRYNKDRDTYATISNFIRKHTGTNEGLGPIAMYGRYLDKRGLDASRKRKDLQRELEEHRQTIARLTADAAGLQKDIVDSRKPRAQLGGTLALPERTGEEFNPKIKSKAEQRLEQVEKSLKKAHGMFDEARQQLRTVSSKVEEENEVNDLAWDGVAVEFSERDHQNLGLARDFVKQVQGAPAPEPKQAVKGMDFDREIPYLGPKPQGPTYDAQGQRVVLPLPDRDGKRTKQLADGKAGGKGAEKNTNKKPKQLRSGAFFR